MTFIADFSNLSWHISCWWVHKLIGFVFDSLKSEGFFHLQIMEKALVFRFAELIVEVLQINTTDRNILWIHSSVYFSWVDNLLCGLSVHNFLCWLTGPRLQAVSKPRRGHRFAQKESVNLCVWQKLCLHEWYKKHSRTPLTLIRRQTDKIATSHCSFATVSVSFSPWQPVYSKFILKALCSEISLSQMQTLS